MKDLAHAALLIMCVTACGSPTGKGSNNGGSDNNGANNGANNGNGPLTVRCDSPTYVTVEPVPIALAGNDTHLFVGSSGSTTAPEVLQIIELSEAPGVVATLDLDSRIVDIVPHDDELFVLTQTELQRIDLSSPAAPTVTAVYELETDGASLAVSDDVIIVSYFWFAEALDASDLSLLQRFEPVDFGSGRPFNDVAIFDDTWWFAGNDGSLTAADPQSRTVRARIELDPPLDDTFVARGIAGFDGHVALQAGDKIVVIDTTDPGAFVEVAREQAGRSNHISQLVALNGSVVVDDGAYDMSNPSDPQFGGTFPSSGFTHWSVGVSDDYLLLGYLNNRGEATGRLEITTPQCARLPN